MNETTTIEQKKKENNMIIIDERLKKGHEEYILEKKELDSFYKEEYKLIDDLFEVDKEKNKANDIITIIGDRGAGKTSFLKSFIKVRKEKEKQEKEDREDKTSYFLEIVEPSKFTREYNILEIVLGNMFKSFKMKIEESGVETTHIEREILEKFQLVYKNIKFLKNKNNEVASEFDELLSISESSNLKKNIENLVDKYLKFMGEKNILVIPIDDIDLNDEFAYQMLEDIRNYLLGPKILILLVTKLEQLANVIAEKFSREYTTMKNLGIDPNGNFDEIINDRVQKYLVKLLPFNKRIYLKSIFSKCKEIKIKLSVKDNEKIIGTNNGELKKYINECVGYIENGIFYIDSKDKKDFNFEFFSDNLRELVFFILKMEQIRTSKDNSSSNDSANNDSNKTNKKLNNFKDFFETSWKECRVKQQDRRFFEEFCKLKTIEEKNQCAYKYLGKKLQYKDEDLRETNISLGEVRHLLNKLRNDYQEKILVFAIETMYSIYIKEGKFDEIKTYKLDKEVDSFGPLTTSFFFHKLKKLSEVDKNNLDKFNEFMEFLKIFVNSEATFTNILSTIPREEEKGINLGNGLSIFKYNSGYLSIIEKKIFNKIKDNKLSVSEKIKSFLKKETLLEEKIKILDETIGKDTLKKILLFPKEHSDSTKKEYIEFREYKERLLDLIIEKNKELKYSDLLDNMLFYINNEKKLGNKSDLDYFLRGIFKNQKTSIILTKDLRFFGVMGGFHMFSKINELIKEKEKKIKFIPSSEKKQKLEEEREYLKIKEKELLEFIISRLDEEGSLKELLHLNECSPNDGFIPEEVVFINKEVDRFLHLNKNFEMISM